MEPFDLLIVDARHLLWRATSVLSAPSNKVRKDGRPFEPLSVTLPDGTKLLTGGVYGFLAIMHSTWKQFGGIPFVAWDSPDGPTERLKIFDNYKHKRDSHAPDDEKASQRREILELIFQGERILQPLLSKMGIRQARSKGWEADDVVATIASKFGGNNRIGILSGDRDLMRLVSDNVTLIRPLKEGKFEVVDGSGVFATYGVDPVQVGDLKALAGDTGDNIPGAYGIGPKTAAKLIHEHGSWDKALEWALDHEPKHAWHNSLIKNAEDVRMSAKLAALNYNVPLSFIPVARDKQKAFQEMARLQFKSMLADGRYHDLINMGGHVDV